MNTVQKPRLIAAACAESERIGQIISEKLESCGYSCCIDDISDNADFIIAASEYNVKYSERVSADTLLFEGQTSWLNEKTQAFRMKVTSYENAMKLYGGETVGVLTYSAENYGADVTCRNITGKNGIQTFDIIGNGILSRLSIISGKYSVEEVLACTGVLLSVGLPLAAVLDYFEY